MRNSAGSTSSSTSSSTRAEATAPRFAVTSGCLFLRRSLSAVLVLSSCPFTSAPHLSSRPYNPPRILSGRSSTRLLQGYT
ncbi:hypothetical protein XA68_16349 [Ophiocordyceps unilateralis]|uniref:Uncharacterized protein n=1 Tax=Ophiocordyceps unilateralis TaxID=268505 RepID=A0A2A9P530_OPHUN|nr:hypothetical protein XA68_16349 [Ophiocordyceps unilateralis]